LKIWDTVGIERDQSVPEGFYKKGNGILIVYDITNDETFNHVPKWID
jgi:GTPase SAR1 family protein